MAARYDIGPKIGIDGEKEFRAAIRSSYNALRTLGTELQVASSEFDKNDKSQKNLTAQNKILNKQIKQQEELLVTLNKGLEESKNKLGENHEHTEKWQQSVNRQTAKLNKLKQEVKSNNTAMSEGALGALGLKKNIDKVGDSASSNGGKLKAFGKVAAGIGKVALKTMAAIKTGAVAAARGILSLVENTREYRSDMSKLEQNTKNANQDFDKMKGHVQSITGLTGEMDSSIEAVSNLMATGFDENGITNAVDALSGAVIKFPDTLKIEGLADGLQETLATGKAVGTFAELIERMGGDLEAFDAEMANATTQAEKQQVALKWLADSGLSEVNEAYREANKGMLNAAEAQLKLDDSMASLASTFEPAVATIKGGVADVLSSLVGMATGAEGSTEDFKKNVGNLVQGILQQIDTLIPMVVATAEALIPALIDGIVTSLPQLIEAAILLLDTLINSIIENLPLIIQAAIKLVNMLLLGIVQSLPLIVDGAAQIIIALVSGIAGSLPTLIPAVVEMVLTIARGLVDNLPLLVNAAVELISGLSSGLMDALPLLMEQAPAILQSLADGIIQALPILIETALSLVMKLVEYLLDEGNLKMLIDSALEIVTELATGILSALPVLIKQAPVIIKSLISGIVSAIPMLIDTAIELVMSFIDFLLDGENIGLLVQSAIEIIFALITGLIGAIPELILAIPKIIKAIIDTFLETDWGKIGWEIIKGIGEGIKNAAVNLWETVKEVASSIFKGFTDFFQINSPSVLMQNDVGKMIGLGMAEGIEDSQREVENAWGTLTKNFNMNANEYSNTTQHNDYSSTDNSRTSQITLQVTGKDEELEYERKANEMLRRVQAAMAY